MKNWIWTRKQKQKLLNELKSNIYTTLKQVETWMISCESREQLQCVLNFLEQKVSQYDYMLSKYHIAFWYTNSIYDEIKEYLFSHIKYLEEINNDILNEMMEYEAEIEKSKKETVVGRGFEKIFYEDDK